MTIDCTGVTKIAELARLEFSERELEEFTPQFRRILDYVEKLKEVSVEGVEPTSHASLPGRSASARTHASVGAGIRTPATRAARRTRRPARPSRGRPNCWWR